MSQELQKDIKSLPTENESTEAAMFEINKKFNAAGGIALVCQYENQNLLSRTDMRGKDVLEIGCGVLPACFGIPDDRMPKTYVATDTIPELIEAARKVDSRPSYYVESGLKPSFNDESFDLIIMRGVLHHLPNPTQALITFRNLLRDGGQLLLYEPNLACIHANIIKWFLWTFFKINMEESPCGQLPYKVIHKSIRDSGFHLEDEWYTSLLAFQLTGDYGRRSVLPDSRSLFKVIISIDKFLSRILHFIPAIAKRTHFRVIFLLNK